MSDLEELLAFQLRAAKIKYEREYRFHPTRRWRFDFAWPAKSVAAELDGGLYSYGRHQRPKGYHSDCDKANTAQLLGWTVLRFTSEHIQSGEALKTIEAALK